MVCVGGGGITRHTREGKPRAERRKLMSHLAAVVQGTDWCPCAVVHQLRLAVGKEAQGPGVVAGVGLIPGDHVLT